MKDLEQMIQYLDGELSEVEKQQLTEKLKSDPSMAEKMALIQDVDKLLGDKKLENFEQTLYEVEKENLAKKPSRKLFLMQVAAVVILIISLAAYFLFIKNNTTVSNHDLFAAYYHKLPADFATRSADGADRFINAIKLYNENRYKEAISEFNNVIEEDPSNNAARLFLGICFTETNDFSKATDHFKNIVSQQDPLFDEHATWYLALCYVKTSQPGSAKPLLTKLVDSRSFYMGKASELLHKLK